jgi:DNA-binding SARP family transcriptional activator
VGIQLVTLGGLHAFDGARELEILLSQRSRAALLVYLTIERRVSRDVLTAMFWPESDSENARHALRQSLYHLTKGVGGRDWIESRGLELRVRPHIEADATAFSIAIEHGHVERALSLYRGCFLDGVHLLDLPSWECWVDARRAKWARVFRKACRELLDLRLTTRDLAGAIAIAERWIATDPADDEAQHRLIATLVLAGERTEALRQYDSYARLLAHEGLEPLDETRQLVEHFRARRRIPNQMIGTLTLALK